MFESLNKKQKIILIIILVCMLLLIAYYIFFKLNTFNYNANYGDTISEETMLENNDSEDSLSEDETSESTNILVHVSGCVKNNKVVTLPEGSRINDAIEAAGGLTKDADLTNINLAYILEDGEKIYIPKIGEIADATADTNSLISSSTNLNSSLSSSSKTQKININKASQSELETIPGIGPSTALKIINYRNENGKFNSIEDIKKVSGIGNAKYEKMKEYITIK